MQIPTGRRKVTRTPSDLAKRADAVAAGRFVCAALSNGATNDEVLAEVSRCLNLEGADCEEARQLVEIAGAVMALAVAVVALRRTSKPIVEAIAKIRANKVQGLTKAEREALLGSESEIGKTEKHFQDFLDKLTKYEESVAASQESIAVKGVLIKP